GRESEAPEGRAAPQGGSQAGRGQGRETSDRPLPVRRPSRPRGRRLRGRGRRGPERRVMDRHELERRVEDLREQHPGREEFVAAVKELGESLDEESRVTLGQVLLER